MTRRRLLLFVFPAVMLAAVVAAWLLWPRSAITRANAAKIQEGMTVAEVEALLGGPPRDDSTGLVLLDENWGTGIDELLSKFPRGIPPEARSAPVEWTSDEAIITVLFDRDGHVLVSLSARLRRGNEPLFNRFRRWLRL